MASVVYRVPDIRCAACALKIEAKIASLPFVTRCRTDLATRRVMVDVSEDGTCDRLQDSIRELGYEPEQRVEEGTKRSPDLMLARLGVAGQPLPDAQCRRKETGPGPDF